MLPWLCSIFAWNFLCVKEHSKPEVFTCTLEQYSPFSFWGGFAGPHSKIIMLVLRAHLLYSIIATEISEICFQVSILLGCNCIQLTLQFLNLQSEENNRNQQNVYCAVSHAFLVIFSLHENKRIKGQVAVFACFKHN